MFRPPWRVSAMTILCLAMVSCASVPSEEAAAGLSEVVKDSELPAPARTGEENQAAIEARAKELLSQPLTAEAAVQLAFLRNPGIHQAYAELDINLAEVVEASRLPNPVIGYSHLSPDGPGHTQITRSASISFTDLLLLPVRRRFAQAGLQREQLRIGNSLLELATEVRAAWFREVAAKQVAALREAVSKASEGSAEFAQRSRDAGNLSARGLALHLAAATQARVASARASADAIEARADLARLLGLSSRADWKTVEGLPAPPIQTTDEPALLETALKQRLDAQGLRSDVELLGSALTLTRRWRFVGAIEVGYERESETDGSTLRGPTLSLALPIFNQGQGAVLRAQGQLELARADLAAIELSIRNEVALGLDALAATRDIAERYTTALIPQREAVVARTQEEYNFMLVDIFELLQAKREEFDAYQEYVEAVRDHWLARTELRRVAGGALPGDEQPPGSTLGVDQILKPTPAQEHPDSQGNPR